jgi:ParB family chromosome partitioning protein
MKGKKRTPVRSEMAPDIIAAGLAPHKKAKQGAEPSKPELLRVPLDRIFGPDIAARATMNDHKFQELVESMRLIGLASPVTLERRESMFEIIAGHRRVLAARELKWADIPAIVHAEGQADLFALRLHENVIREDLNPAEEALFMAQARDKLALDEAGLCNLFKRPPDYIAGRFALMRGDPEIFKALLAGEIRLGVAHELNRMGDDGMRRFYLDVARKSDPPARLVHQWVEDWKLNSRPPLPIEGGELVDGRAPGSANGGAPGELAGGGSDAAGVGAVAPPFFGCDLCGGDRDPYNLVHVKMHKWEWEQIQASVAKAGRGE